MRTENAFWDTSSIVPLCCVQEFSSFARRAYRRFPQPVIWWGTPVEVQSAFRRLEMADALDDLGVERARRLWRSFRAKSCDVAPDDNLLKIAEDLPKTYSLRAMDAFQLAAALSWCGERPRKRPFVCADNRLSEAAKEAGFNVVSFG